MSFFYMGHHYSAYNDVNAPATLHIQKNPNTFTFTKEVVREKKKVTIVRKIFFKGKLIEDCVPGVSDGSVVWRLINLIYEQ